MTEQVPPTSQEAGQPAVESPVTGAEATSTGVPAVDRVLADLDILDGAPLDEHLARFERAHESLRSALDATPVDRSDQSA